MSRDIVKAITESNLIEGITGQQAVDDSLLAWKYLSDLDVLTLHDIKMVHWLITHNQLPVDERGTYRFENQIGVTVGGYTAPAHYMVLELMLNWLQQAVYNDAKTAHIMFEKIHPFVDGNGRTGRLIYYWQDEKAPIILNAEKRSYYAWFRNDTEVSGLESLGQAEAPDVTNPPNTKPQHPNREEVDTP